MKRLIRNYLGRRALKRQRRSESLSDPRMAPSTKSTLRGAVDPVSGRLAHLEAENRRLAATNMDQRVMLRDLRAEVRALKVEKHNAFLRELVEDEDLMTLLFAERPDLLRRVLSENSESRDRAERSTPSRDSGTRYDCGPCYRHDHWDCKNPRVCPCAKRDHRKF